MATKSFDAVAMLLLDLEEDGLSSDEDNLAALRLATEKLDQRWPDLSEDVRIAIMRSWGPLIH